VPVQEIFYPALAALVSPVQNIFSLAVHYFNLPVANRPTTWAGSRAGPLVSECVSPIRIKSRVFMMVFANR